MSFKAMAFATEQTITQTSPQSHLLLILASYANDNNECYPSIKTMAAKTRLSVNTIRKCLKELGDFGLIIDTGKVSAFGSKVYQVNFNAEDSPPTKSDTPTKFGSTKSDSDPLPNLTHPPTKNGSTPLPNLVANPISNHKNNPKENSKGTKKPKSTTQPPNDLKPTQAQIKKCLDNGLDVSEEFERFTNYHLSKGNSFVNWSLAFSNWISNSVKFAKPKLDKLAVNHKHGQSEVFIPKVSEQEYDQHGNPIFKAVW